MAVTINIPSQVKTYANLAAFPATGAVKTIYIAEDTNKTYRWTGTAYVEISASAAMTWGQIGGTLSNQTDLQTALNAKQDSLGFTAVPTTRTLTINGTTQDLSANRTFTIPTDLTIGTTPIASGIIGRVLFQGTGNVLQQSSSLFWDSTNNRLGIGTATPTRTLEVNGETMLRDAITLSNSGDRGRVTWGGGYFSFQALGSEGLSFMLPSNARVISIPNATGNVLINTTTDAGFKLDVNGTARVQNDLSVSRNQNNPTKIAVSNTTAGNNSFVEGGYASDSSSGECKIGKYSSTTSAYKIITASNAYLYNGTIAGDIAILNDFATGRIKFSAGGSSTAQMTLFSTGNFAINTTTDAGFRLDVNGTARVDQTLRLNGTGNGELINFGGNIGRFTIDGSFIRLKAANGGDIMNVTANFFGVNQTSTISSAIMAITSTDRGFLPPRMTTTQRNAIASPAAGLQVYDTTLNRPCFYDGTTWITL